RAFLGAGAWAYDLLTLDRNFGIHDPRRHIRRSRLLSRRELLRTFPHLRRSDLSGAVVFEDGQMYSPARIVLGFVKAAVAAAAAARRSTYRGSPESLYGAPAVRGRRVHNRMSGEQFETRPPLPLNAAGPWADYLQRDPQRFGAWQRKPFSRDAYFIIDREPT